MRKKKKNSVKKILLFTFVFVVVVVDVQVLCRELSGALVGVQSEDGLQEGDHLVLGLVPHCGTRDYPPSAQTTARRSGRASSAARCRQAPG